MKTQKLLDEETERNRDNVAHCEALQKHYEDRVTAYEVHICHNPVYHLNQFSLCRK